MLDKIARKYLTDKRIGHHGYTTYYENHFNRIRNNSLKILEIGVKEARSLKMWEEYFPNSKIYGIDINPKCKQYETDRTKIFIGNQADSKFLTGTMKSIGEVDIIIDDGSHKNIHQQISFKSLFPFLKNDGLYIIEDLHSSYSTKHSYNGGYKKEGTTIEFLKELLDTVNYPSHLQKIDEFTRKVGYLHIYQDICFISKQVKAWQHDDVLIDLISKNNFERVAEIGVLKGKLTKRILCSLCQNTLTEYWAIDPWKVTDEHSYLKTFTQKNWDDIYAEVCKKMRWAEQLRVLRLTSERASKLFGRGHFDLVYIDGNHHFNNVINDIKLWLPRIRKGGILCGHDYGRAETEVKEAIDKYFGNDVVIDKKSTVWIKYV